MIQLVYVIFRNDLYVQNSFIGRCFMWIFSLLELTFNINLIQGLIYIIKILMTHDFNVGNRGNYE